MECDIQRDPFIACSFDSSFPSLQISSPCKRRRTHLSLLNGVLPVLRSPDYYTQPSLKELGELELLNPGYCSRVRDFTIGRVGYGSVKFIGETDVRYLDLEEIVKFNRHVVVVYEHESSKPPVGQGLNKPAVVTLILKLGTAGLGGDRFGKVGEMLRASADRQGAEFISYDPLNGYWRFSVCHFSRFGLNEDDEEDIVMDDADPVEDPIERDDGDPIGVVDDGVAVGNGFDAGYNAPELSHSLPAHLGLDPVRMKQMKMLMFPVDDDDEAYAEIRYSEKRTFHREKSPLVYSGPRKSSKPSPPPPRKTPLALLEYKHSSIDANAPGTLVLAQQNKGLPLKVGKQEGYKLDTNRETLVSGYHSQNIVDAGLFMGRSFRVGWGPNGVFIHSGTRVGSKDNQGILSSMITLEKVAIDKVARDEKNEVRKEAVDLLFDSPLDLHKSLDHSRKEIEVGSLKLSLQKVVSDCLVLPDICRRYIEVVEKQLESAGQTASVRLSLMHQVMVWELIRVLFSEKETNGRSKFELNVDEEDMMQDGKGSLLEIEPEALPLVRRAEFSYWLQESVYHRVQEDVSCLDEFNDLEHIFLLLTGRQLDAAVELAASRGDVRLACLLSGAGGSMVNRADIAQQLDIWRINGMDFNFIEKDRIWLLELLSGNIQNALVGKTIDWKRFLGLLMWYELPPDTALPAIFHTYQHLLTEGKAPYPVPVYIDEGPVKDEVDTTTEGRFDIAYYLLLLHAREDGKFDHLKSMLSALASTDDPLDYHMIWHQRAILEAIGAFSSSDLHTLDMLYVSQLLCLGKCHWAIYVVLHMPYREDYPYLHAVVIREILFQYCETWSTQEEQHKFIEELGVPLQWLHEAMVK
ncbi:hypothetical protein Cgig2_010016 [Carnegiea gigantea]|uniref:Peptidase S59 domain-containing protein n=1 Tax=Carnegiea gigantea TaxID=171969 RepID=A0A9Q1Q599_9CARY|nr:hypothetical protein Cgig2_010016 [Carnegiea gigantea]